MGRYYTGDIEGEFWFAVQSSNDADFFGVTGYQPDRLDYYFDKEEDLAGVNSGIDHCMLQLGKFKKKLDAFFEMNNGYNDEMIMESFGISKERVKVLLEWYARLKLGTKIKECLEKNGECSFDAEC